MSKVVPPKKEKKPVLVKTNVKQQVKQKQQRNRKRRSNVFKSRDSIRNVISSELPQNARVDPRFTKNTTSLSTENIISTIQPAIVIDAVNPDAVFCGVPLAVVSYALTRGWQNFEDPSFPFMAFVYLSQLIFNARSNTVPQALDVPRWLEIYLNMITPKHCKFLAGTLNDRWIVGQTQADTIATPTMVVGPPLYASRWNVGIITGTAVNGIFRTIDVANTYNADTGVKAYASLVQFLAGLDHLPELKKMHALSTFKIDKRFSTDVSSFATNLSKPGGGFAEVGSFVSVINSEVPIHRPLFSCHASNSNGNYEPGRYPNFMHKFAGDTIFLGGALTSLLGEDQLALKRAPTFHCIDINEIGDVLCQAMTQAVRLALDDSQIRQSIKEQGLDTFLQCPLTVQEVMLLLRANLMSAFSNTQPFVQGIYPRGTSSTNDNEFVALVAGFGTCPLSGNTGMTMPLVLVENIRSLTYRQNTGHRGGDRNPALYVPVLGIYAGDRLNEQDYVINYQIADSHPGTLAVFTAESSLSQEIVEGKKKKILAPEIISLIDGKGASDYVAINDPGAISQLTTQWNEWINTISSFLQTMDTIGTDAGINSMAMCLQTMFWQPAPGKKKEIGPSRFARKQMGSSALYDSRYILGYTFSVAPFKACWENIQQQFISPVLHHVVTPDNKRDTSFQAMAAALNEPLQMSIVESDSGSSIGKKHYILASYMVKSRNASPNHIDNFLLQEAKKGRGGILGGIASQLFQSLAPIGLSLAQQGLSKIPY